MNTNQLHSEKTNYEIIATYENDDMKSYVRRGKSGYIVELQDMDSEEFLPKIRIFPYDKFPTDAAAKDHARFLVYGPRTQEDTPSLDAPWFAHL
jgi:hypothetical protein